MIYIENEIGTQKSNAVWFLKVLKTTKDKSDPRDPHHVIMQYQVDIISLLLWLLISFVEAMQRPFLHISPGLEELIMCKRWTQDSRKVERSKVVMKLTDQGMICLFNFEPKILNSLERKILINFYIVILEGYDNWCSNHQQV